MLLVQKNNNNTKITQTRVKKEAKERKNMVKVHQFRLNLTKQGIICHVSYFLRNTCVQFCVCVSPFTTTTTTTP